MMKNYCKDSLRELRRKKNYSQEFMAEELGISQKAYSDIENGKTTLKHGVLEKLSKVLDVSQDDLCPISNNCLAAISSKNKQLIELLELHNVKVPAHLNIL